MERYETQAVVIGGGATGAGTLRDLSLRGIKSILIEKDDIASGTTGRNHGLLHSGARYAVKDLESARECISENRILKKIARHCIEDTGGLFVTLPEDDPVYHNELLEGCKISDINAREISIKEALRLEPNLNHNILSAIWVPDGTIDPFRLAASNILDAKEHGAGILTHTMVTGLELKSGGNIVRAADEKGNQIEIRCDLVINAAGVWGQHVCSLGGIELKMFPSKGSMLIIDYRINNIVVNRCRKPSDGDIIVPGDTVSLIGTTSREIDYSRIEELRVDDDEIDVLLEDGEKLIPNVSKTRALRAYCGVRPLVAISGETMGRNISRGIVLIDHSERDGAEGLITIAGGKLMTYRLMAEMTADLACSKLGTGGRCRTAKTPLPGSEKKISERKNVRAFTGISQSVVGSTLYRHGLRVQDILKRDKKNYRLICECEMVTEGEAEYAIKKLDVKNIIDLRRRTRIGMGPCQGELCAYRSAGLFADFGIYRPEKSIELLYNFLEERWKGIKPVLWGDGLRESEFTYWIYEGLLGIGEIKFDDDPGDGDGV
ncbi:MAG: anaerobic glycerol-3-phosphate dehydrogenase subunit A [Spirochaetes bacterium]|jgi:glycerol-3-phosphate dehydrogenase|nr:anaerobic glycerol-3-phosphate dehydrogenase subunit A [Spirochaetota bacterium]